MYLVNLFFLKVIFILFFIFLLVEIVVTWSDCVTKIQAKQLLKHCVVKHLFSQTFKVL